MLKNSKQISNRRLAHYNAVQMRLLLSTPPKTSEKQSWLLDSLAFVSCCVMGYMIMVML